MNEEHTFSFASHFEVANILGKRQEELALASDKH